MKVANLIKLLSSVDPELEVKVSTVNYKETPYDYVTMDSEQQNIGLVALDVTGSAVVISGYEPKVKN